MRKLKKKLMVSVIAVITVAAAVLTGCGSQSNDTASTENSSSDAKTVKLAFSAITPFIYYDDNEELAGYEYELIKSAFDKLPQYKLEVEATEWDSVLTGLDAARYDLAVGCIFRNEEREEKYYFSNPLSNNKIVLIVRDDDDSIHTLEDLAGKKTLTSSPGTLWGIALDNYNKENPDKAIEVEYAQNDQVTSLNALVDGKYDFYFYDLASWLEAASKFDVPLKYIELSEEDNKTFAMDNNSYALYSRTDDSKQLVDDVNQAIEELVKDGTAKELSQKYFNEDLSPKLQ